MAPTAPGAHDAELMGTALEQGLTARPRSAPNPWVGCIVVQGGEIIGAGATQPPGGPHAEVEALTAAGDRAKGATVYVTLEPCSHHGRTPPCVDALVAAGVARVVVAIADPDAQVAGAGIAALRAQGITVDVGIGDEQAEHDLAPYLVHRRERRASAVVKLATSLDGRIAAADGTSRWITGAEARADAHRLRAESQAVVVGAGTALADAPALTVRDAEPAPAGQPLRVVLDARGRVPATGPLFDTSVAPTLVLTTDAAPGHAVDAWLAAGAKVHHLPAGPDGAGVDLRAALGYLGGIGVVQALVEGGAALAGSFLAAGLADRVVAYVAPTVLGVRGLPGLALDGPVTIDDATRFCLTSVEVLGDDVRLDYVPRLRGGTADRLRGGTAESRLRGGTPDQAP